MFFDPQPPFPSPRPPRGNVWIYLILHCTHISLSRQNNSMSSMSCICFSILDKDFSSSGGLGRRRSKAIFLNINIADIGVTIFPMAGETALMKIAFRAFFLFSKRRSPKGRRLLRNKIFVVFVIWLKRNMILSSSNLWNRCFVAHDVTLKKWVSFFALPENNRCRQFSPLHPFSAKW